MYTYTRTPLRVSFGGGGTDIPSYYLQGEGAVISTTINKYVEVVVFDRETDFPFPIADWSFISSESNDIVSACSKYLSFFGDILVASRSDIRHSSGLGSSGAFIVGLLKAYYDHFNKNIDRVSLAEEAFHIESELLNNPIGKQDHYSASIGGLNAYNFRSDNSVAFRQIEIEAVKRDDLFDCLSLYWTGLTRRASTILSEQMSRHMVNVSALDLIRSDALAVVSELESNSCIEDLGRRLHSNWLRKKTLASTITNPIIDQMYDAAVMAGAYGGKLCGAGGGGFLLIAEHPNHRSNIRKALEGFCCIPLGYEPSGTQVIRSSRMSLG